MTLSYVDATAPVHENASQAAGLTPLARLQAQIDSSEFVLIGIGQEWHYVNQNEASMQTLSEAYQTLARLVKGKPYFILTECTDDLIFHSPLLNFFICAPYATNESEASSDERWRSYLNWLSSTLGHQLCILELGVGFEHPDLIRWPFEQCARFNQKAYLLRVHHTLAFLPEGLGDRGEAIKANSPLLLSVDISL